MNARPKSSNGPPPVRQPKAGDVVRLTTKASVQFAGVCAMVFRIIRVDPRETYAGWVWLIGYSLDASGRAIERREVFVQIAGLIYVTTPRVPPAE
ncbi:hypothetical protein ACTOB_000590 [Actinoplanes oblitus]|uniref:Uncharacterized protein n=1 Tax=Actinoplanes oblitus TaxID=3040509 RepID=A0ABY8WJ51_9ACTN|nr:hypothetical protein [Actinoplanes oblitus]WIM97096.1 hypothetical protein ACTOB_000590 [Actinoplanes oblitus]